MSKFDNEYIDLCKKILNEGVEVQNRTGVNSLKIPTYSFEFDLSKEFPILQSKQTFIRQAIIEMLWIWQMQSNDVRELHKRNVHIWDEWMVDGDGIYRIYEADIEKTPYDPDRKVPVFGNFIVNEDNRYGNDIPIFDKNHKIMYAKSKIEGKNIKAAKYFGPEYAYTIGTAYGYITNRYKHTQNLINTLKNNPNDRRMVKSLWQDDFIRTAVLPSCVWSTEWDVTGDKLSLLVHQRSCDVPLGLPFNVPQYSAMLMMISQVTGLKAGMIQYSIKDAHIYVNQIKEIEEQIRRWEHYNLLRKKKSANDLINNKKSLEFALSCDLMDKVREAVQAELNVVNLALSIKKPELVINPNVDDFFKFDNSKDLNDVTIKNYRHLGKIKIPRVQ